MTISEVPAHAWDTAKLSLCATLGKEKECIFLPQQTIGPIEFTGHSAGAVTPQTNYFAHTHIEFGYHRHHSLFDQRLTITHTDAVQEHCLSDGITGDISCDESQVFLGRSVRCLVNAYPKEGRLVQTRSVLSCCSLTSLEHSIRR